MPYIKYILLIAFFSFLFSALMADELPVINLFEVECKEKLSPGDGITASVIGTPGAQVWIEISDVPLKIYLPEISPGLYQGSYFISSDVPSVYRKSIFAHMAMSGLYSPSVSVKQKITIMGTSPLFYDLSPQDDTLVRDLRPLIYASLDNRGEAIDTASIKLIVNRQDVTTAGETVITPNSIAFKPSKDLKDGENTVYISGNTKNGNDFSIEWNFFVKIASSITSISHSGTKVLSMGDILDVTMMGDPYQKAYFNIGEWRKNIPMNESFRSPGTYVGSYTIQNGDFVSNCPLICNLELQDGETVSLKSPNLVTIVTDDLLVNIISPVDSEKVTNPFIITGQTKPFVKVQIDIEVTSVVLGLGSITIPGPITSELMANELGVFKTNLTIPVTVGPGSEYKLTFTAIDAQGHKSEPYVTRFYQK